MSRTGGKKKFKIYNINCKLEIIKKRWRKDTNDNPKIKIETKKNKKV